MTDVSEIGLLFDKAKAAGQECIFRWWDELDDHGRRKLVHQAKSVDFDLVSHLIAKYLHSIPEKFDGEMEPVPLVPLPRTEEQMAEAARMAAVGEEAIRRGEVCVFIVAGGQGTRLKYDPPKGTFPVCPLSKKSLFEAFAEKIIAAKRRYGVEIPLYVMTSLNNNNATQEFFRINKHFGLGKRNVYFAQQKGMLPAVDFSGKIILKQKDEISLSPNGHGESIRALYDSGALADICRRGIKYISYHQVDNVLVRSIDPVFLGYHIAGGSEMSLKVLRKRDAEEKLGVVGRVDGAMRVVEYSELSDRVMRATNSDGSLVYATGSIAIHILNAEFVVRINQGELELPWHVAKKAVPHVDANGQLVKPDQSNGIKFERFVFDALPRARHAVVVETSRDEEFAPVKNSVGEDSPVTARRAMANFFGRWLKQAGIHVPLDDDGNVKGMIEISPLYAIDYDELASKIDASMQFNGELLLQ